LQLFISASSYTVGILILSHSNGIINMIFKDITVIFMISCMQ
jgi:hypothetical protein